MRSTYTMNTTKRVSKKLLTTMLIIALFLMSIVSVTALTVTINDHDPKPAEAGKYLNVWFRVDNTANDAYTAPGAYLKIIPKDGLTLTQGEPDQQIIRSIKGRSYETYLFRFFVEDDAVEGPNQIEAIIGTPQGETKVDLEIEVEDKDFKEIDLAIGDIESDPTRIKPGDDDVQLEVTLQNLGDGIAKNVKGELSGFPRGVTLTESYSGTSLLGNIEADGTGLATFYLDVDEDVISGEYDTDLTLSYKYKPDEDEDDFVFEEETIPLNLAIKSIPQYEIVNVSYSPSELTAGDKPVFATITIKNVGKEEGESVRIKAYGKTEQPFSYDEGSDFVAPSLKPGEMGQGTLRLKIDNDANLQLYYMDLEIKNVVNDDVLTYSKKVPLEIKYPRPNTPWTWYIVGIIAIVIVVLVMMARGRKAKPRAKKVVRKYNRDYLEK